MCGTYILREREEGRMEHTYEERVCVNQRKRATQTKFDKVKYERERTVIKENNIPGV